MKILNFGQRVWFRIRRPKAIQFECEWTLGHGGFMVPDPTVVNHPDLRELVKGFQTRVTVELLGSAPRPQVTQAHVAAL